MNAAHDPSAAAAAQAQRLRAVAEATSPGTAQHQRMPAALAPGWFEPDERSLADWVALLATHAQHLRLPSLSETAAPDDARWSVLFQRDEALLLALLASGHGDPAARTLLQPSDSGSPAALRAELTRLRAWLQHTARRLQRCEGEDAAALHRALLALLLPLPAPDQAERATGDGDPAAGPQAGQPERGAAGEAPGAAPVGGPAEEASRAGAAASAHQGLRRAVALYRAAIARLCEQARDHLPASLASGQHDAAAALLLSALSAGAVVQRHGNRFPGRLQQHYVDEVLGLRPHAARPDCWVAIARREPGAPFDAVLPAGTRFAAGKDEAGRDIVLRTLRSALVDAAQVVALHTLRLVRDPTISPEHELGYVARARCQTLPPGLPASTADGPLEAQAVPVWPLFGGSELPAAGAASTDARFGLAIASPLLLLEEGEREITVTLRLSHVATADARLQALARAHAQQLQEGGAAQAARTLAELFQGYTRLERRRPAHGLPPVNTLVAAAAARLAVLPAAQRTPLAHYRCFLLLRALQAKGAGFRFAAGRLFVHWLLAPPTPAGPGAAEGAAATPALGGRAEPDWLLDALDDRAALHAAACAALPEVAAAVRQGGGRSLADDPLGVFLLDASSPQQPEREIIFAQLLGGLFAARCSATAGWYEAPEVHLLRPGRQPEPGVDLQVVIRLPAGAPPLVPLQAEVHGPGWDTSLPVLQLLLRSSGGMYPYAMLESAQLLTVDVAVQVQGLRRVALHNQIGPLDPGKPFQPFGPLPAVGQHLVLGARELACKPLTALTLHLRWSGLPTGPGGFAAHYAGWPAPPSDGQFRVTPAVLRDGQWVDAGGASAGGAASAADAGARGPSSPGTEPSRPLFARAGPQGGLAPASRIALDARLLRHHHQPLSGALPEAAPAFDVGARGGLFRLQLTHPATAFGHAEYAGVLTNAVQANARKRIATPRALPSAPYTPLLDGLTLDYAAQSRIHVGRADAAAAADPHAARVFHLHPFGIACVHPQPQAGVCRLLPQVLHDGTLFIGLAAPAPPRRVALLFHLHGASAAAGPVPPPIPRWHALHGDRWLPLAPTQVLADSTDGFLSTGIVELELPAGLDTAHRVMPDGLYWLALGVDGGFARFAGLHGVHAQALALQRETAADTARAVGDGAATPDDPTALAPLPARPALRALRPVPGLGGAQAVALVRGVSPVETRTQLQVRAGERLRHRQRAVLPWDYERLLLAHFPDIAQAKCFAASALAPALCAAAAGRVLVAVLPGAQRREGGGSELAPRISAAELAAMQRLLQSLAPAGVRVWVRHAVYEWVQLRCRVRLDPGAAEGAVLRACEQAVVERLDPWRPGAVPPRFGWSLRAELLESALRGVPGVAHVTGMSLLKLVRDDRGTHRLADTARSDDAAVRDRAELRPDLPWSVAVPMDRHLITPTRQAQGHAPVPTGIARLTVGRNFVIGRSNA